MRTLQIRERGALCLFLLVEKIHRAGRLFSGNLSTVNFSKMKSLGAFCCKEFAFPKEDDEKSFSIVAHAVGKTLQVYSACYALLGLPKKILKFFIVFLLIITSYTSMYTKACTKIDSMVYVFVVKRL